MLYYDIAELLGGVCSEPKPFSRNKTCQKGDFNKLISTVAAPDRVDLKPLQTPFFFFTVN
jgi:hypothetical protein